MRLPLAYERSIGKKAKWQNLCFLIPIVPLSLSSQSSTVVFSGCPCVLLLFVSRLASSALVKGSPDYTIVVSDERGGHSVPTRGHREQSSWPHWPSQRGVEVVHNLTRPLLYTEYMCRNEGYRYRCPPRRRPVLPPGLSWVGVDAEVNRGDVEGSQFLLQNTTTAIAEGRVGRCRLCSGGDPSSNLRKDQDCVTLIGKAVYPDTKRRVCEEGSKRSLLFS